MVHIAASSFIFAAFATCAIATPTFSRQHRCGHGNLSCKYRPGLETSLAPAIPSSSPAVVTSDVSSTLIATTIGTTESPSATATVVTSVLETVTSTDIALSSPAVEVPTSRAVETTPTVSSSASTVSSSSPAPAIAVVESADITEYLNTHNTVRAQHGATNLVWNATLATVAQSWSDKCQFKHSGGPFGENLQAGTGSNPITAAVGSWASEVKDYNPSSPVFSHFTQMVWKATTQLGCAVTTCSPGAIFDATFGASKYYVCEYFPAGNVIGQFGANVQV